MKMTIENRINSVTNSLNSAINYLSEDLEAICDDTMRDYATYTLDSVQKAANHAAYLKKNMDLYLDALTDIAILAGWEHFTMEDSKTRNLLFRQWAEEFVDIHKETDWVQNDYYLLVDNFTTEKLKQYNQQTIRIDDTDKKYSISYVLGTEAVREYSNCVDSGEKWNISSLCDCGSVSHGVFATQAELDAYKQGIADATGYLESEVMMTEDEWQKYLEEYFSDEENDD